MGLIEINFHQFISDTLIFRDFIFDNCRINESRGYASLLFIQNSDSRGSPMPFTLQMERCTFTQLSSNQRGGGFQLGGTAYNFNININYNAYTSLNLNNCTFAHNYTPKEGGAISLIVLSPIIITNCIFRNNTGSQGGAFYIRTYFNNESLPHCTITNCTFIENEDINSSTNSVLYFDNLDQAETETNIVISKCTFYNNLKSHSNNGYCISGPARSFVIEGNHFNNDNNIDSSCGAFFTERRSMLNISNNYFVQCNPHAIYYLPLSGHDNEEEIVIINCTFDSNNADKIGLAIHLFNLANSNLILSNLSFLNHNTDKLLIYITSLITPNEIRLSFFNFINNTYRGSSNCGGIGIDFNKVPSLIFYHCIFESNFSPSKGGAIHLSNSKIEFDGCDFSRNSAPFDGGACYFEQNNSVVMTNCVFNENQASNNGSAIVAQSNIAITRCHFSNCKSHNSQFYIHTHLTGVACLFNHCSFSYSRQEIDSNSTRAVYVDGNILVSFNTCNFTNYTKGSTGFLVTTNEECSYFPMIVSCIFQGLYGDSLLHCPIAQRIEFSMCIFEDCNLTGQHGTIIECPYATTFIIHNNEFRNVHSTNGSIKHISNSTQQQRIEISENRFFNCGTIQIYIDSQFARCNFDHLYFINCSFNDPIYGIKLIQTQSLYIVDCEWE